MKKGIDNVKIYSKIPLKKLINFYQKSDIFLFPSIHEGFPKVALEASSCGLPTILFNDYKPEIVLNGETGFIVKDFKEMLEKLAILINNVTLRIEMGKKARDYAKNFDWHIIVKKWEEVFVKAIEARYDER